ncbi:hypothetical protein EJB05_57460, partial [Eragrostis curvula]
MAEISKEYSLHLVVFPWLARIRLVPLPLPNDVEGLPDGAESTADLPPEKSELLEVAFDGLAPRFSAFLADLCNKKKPDWILVDYAHHWLPAIADEHGVPCALFMTFPATMFCAPTPRPRYEAAWVAGASEPNASGVSDVTRFRETARRCRALVFRTADEFDGPLCPALAGVFRLPALPAGMLAPQLEAAAALADGDANDGELMRWLDAQPEGSVLYAAFGSEAPLTAAHVREVALGLELAGVRFLWALRPRSAELLPAGFERRVAESGRGVVRAGWVPQLQILAHAAVGAFMTHAGLSSVVEGLLFGRRLVLLPLFGDQGHNARAMAARRVGVQVHRNEDDGSFAAADVATAVRRVMADGEEGEEFASNARELREVLRDRSRQERYIDELAQSLRQLAGM